jgi:hypothetical protein
MSGLDDVDSEWGRAMFLNRAPRSDRVKVHLAPEEILRIQPP